MNQANLIQCQVLDPQLKPLLRENNDTPFQRKSLLIKFNSAKICQVVIKLNQKPRNIVATLTNLQNQSSKTNQLGCIISLLYQREQKSHLQQLDQHELVLHWSSNQDRTG
ncbi:unnamed protein product (macronuclear) [Paramecium tetraurelia]|uniref:Uncharacterized protein n=1 Tax=Paramecium tetraurelia TaxID=5888 RepID=A0DN66_PARTE|nr:uncharacterized protein GSPATT00018688001 [Paramecium tetraurelia]CAK84483.1 unnamed protein product [Paramecium tetraurelia]|eukprot:XP_001451880.1 hypothetical protein (macronuclear) [Paramecium tetraurelia strain d4-2]